eukprot:CAMPEP_0180562010 /NCGR_PEP_ID=MMETSP1037_2-20121125/3687_1 /TAXON_ID=632150 /ORGANISM="Azadinium spinosum, Strain 3D9" /LENGTH=534 /DNA_ID=CAMNT_0022578691 /DNA_START=93 /DNA_END=1697 /DNA_ORIENTATION=+
MTVISKAFLAAWLSLFALPADALDSDISESMSLSPELHFLASTRNVREQQKFAAAIFALPWQRPDCPLLKLMIPSGVAAIVVLCAFALLRRQAKSIELAEWIRLLILLPQYICLVGSTIIVIDSYELAERVGMAPGDSGQLVGLNWLGAALGFFTVWFALRQDPMIWRKQAKTICGSGLLVNIMGILLYVYGVHNVVYPGSNDVVLWIIKSARILGGFGQGVVAQFMVVTIQSLTAKADMGDQMTRVFVVNALGVGSGPVFAAGAHILAACPSKNFSLVVAPLVQLVFSCGCLFALVALFPDMKQVELPEEPTIQSTTSGTSSAVTSDIDGPSSVKRRQILIASCIILFVLRNFVASGVEVGSALLLEREFSLDRRLVGVAVGITFMAVIPVKIVHQSLKDSLTIVGWFRIFACLAFSGTMLLFQAVSQMMPGAAALLLGDAIIFPSAFMADGLSYGVLMVNVFPDGSLLDKNHSALFCNVLGMSIGRLSGPWLARYQLELLGPAGQNRYALGQMLACAVIVLVFEVGVRPRIK